MTVFDDSISMSLRCWSRSSRINFNQCLRAPFMDGGLGPFHKRKK